MSWAFTVDAWEYDKTNRTQTIKKVKKVYDVSAVSIPANQDTEINARSWVDGVIEAEKQELLEQVELAKKKILLFLRRKEMNLQEIIARLAKIDEEVRTAEKVEAIDKLATEKKELLERKAELEEIEARKQTALDITAGAVTPNVLETRKGQKHGL